MKNFIISLLIGATCLSIVPPTQVLAIDLNNTVDIHQCIDNLDEECLDEEHLIEEPERIVEERQAFFVGVFTALCGVTFKNAKHYVHTIHTWNSKNPIGYSNWVKKVNEGKHCYNMCPKHINPPTPSSYGFKTSYACNEMTCTKK